MVGETTTAECHNSDAEFVRGLDVAWCVAHDEGFRSLSTGLLQRRGKDVRNWLRGFSIFRRGNAGGQVVPPNEHMARRHLIALTRGRLTDCPSVPDGTLEKWPDCRKRHDPIGIVRFEDSLAHHRHSLAVGIDDRLAEQQRQKRVAALADVYANDVEPMIVAVVPA